MIGFTGTLGEATMKQITAVHKKEFERLRIGLIVSKAANKISKKIIYD